MPPILATVQTDEPEETPKEEEIKIPPYGTREWIHYWSESEGNLPSPINVSITNSTKYWCPELKWYNFDVFPHKVKLTNTGYTLLLGAKWKTERPYLEGGPFLEKHVISQAHFHWGKNMMEGSDHTVDDRRHPGELQVTFFRSEYMTQEEALRHPDGVVVICYLIRYGVNPDERLDWIIEGFPRIREAQTTTRINPYPISRLLPMFFEDYFLYWGNLNNVKGESFTVRWLIPRVPLFASLDQEYVKPWYLTRARQCRTLPPNSHDGSDSYSQSVAFYDLPGRTAVGLFFKAARDQHREEKMKQFRKLLNPWDEPNLGNFRPLQEQGDRHIFFISPHWSQYNSLLPIARVPEPSISELSPKYKANLWMLPPQNAYMLPEPTEEKT